MTNEQIQQRAEHLARSPRLSTQHMTFAERVAGIRQMLLDLHQLATADGCIAAAWAYEYLTTDEAGRIEREVKE